MDELNVEAMDEIINDLGTNYKKDEEVLEKILKEVNSIAFDISNSKDNEKLFPYIKKATKAIYLSRGGEGLKNRTEGSLSSSYENILETLRNDIIKNGLRRLR